MRRAASVVLVALLLCVAGRALAAEQVDPGRPKKSTTGAVFRSLAVPGWGQFYTKSYVKAFAFLAGETSLLIGISRNHDLMMAAKKADVFENEKFYRGSRNKLIWWFAAVKLLSLGDAYVDAQLFEIDISPSLTSDGSTAMQVGATIRF